MQCRLGLELIFKPLTGGVNRFMDNIKKPSYHRFLLLPSAAEQRKREVIIETYCQIIVSSD